MTIATFDPDLAAAFQKLSLLDRAIMFATTQHAGQLRKSKAGAPTLPYIVHPLDVMSRLVRAGVTDQITLAAAVLHDTIEDCEGDVTMKIVYDMQRKTVRVLNADGRIRLGFVGVTNPDNFAHELARLVEADEPPLVRRVFDFTDGREDAAVLKLTDGPEGATWPEE